MTDREVVEEYKKGSSLKGLIEKYTVLSEVRIVVGKKDRGINKKEATVLVSKIILNNWKEIINDL